MTRARVRRLADAVVEDPTDWNALRLVWAARRALEGPGRDAAGIALDVARAFRAWRGLPPLPPEQGTP